jgi:hypothetical protein
MIFPLEYHEIVGVRRIGDTPSRYLRVQFHLADGQIYEFRHLLWQPGLAHDQERADVRERAYREVLRTGGCQPHAPA